MNPIKMTPSLILVVIAAIIFAVAAYEAKPHELKNASFDLCLGLGVYMVSILAGAFTGKS
jgi:uncharacterized membrane protein YjjB (DUF3815 family)